MSVLAKMFPVDTDFTLENIMFKFIKEWWKSPQQPSTLPQDYCSQDNPVVYEEVEHKFNYDKGKVCGHYKKKTPQPMKKDISEPVISFVECVLREKGRFVFRRFNTSCSESYYYCYDKKFKKGYAVVDMRDFYGVGGGFLNVKGGKIKIECTKFLSDDELNFIYKNLIKPMKERYGKYTRIKRQRKERDQLNKLTKLYREEK